MDELTHDFSPHQRVKLSPVSMSNALATKQKNIISFCPCFLFSFPQNYFLSSSHSDTAFLERIHHKLKSKFIALPTHLNLRITSTESIFTFQPTGILLNCISKVRTSINYQASCQLVLAKPTFSEICNKSYNICKGIGNQKHCNKAQT
jgi:hypothetical protein